MYTRDTLCVPTWEAEIMSGLRQIKNTGEGDPRSLRWGGEHSGNP